MVQPETAPGNSGGAPGFAALCAAVRDTLGLHLESYRTRQIERRLEFFRQRHALAGNEDLAARLRVDAGLRQQFANFLTINVSEFFRNPDRFTALRDSYLPALLARRRSLRVWSAGCSIGAEIYSVALLLHELAPRRGHQLLATDIDEQVLLRARNGQYEAEEIKGVPAPLRLRYFQQVGSRWQVVPAVKQSIQFRRHDLLRDPFPTDLDLILCRNVVIYFTDEAKTQLYQRFAASLQSGGILFIGATESIFTARSIGLSYLSPCFYAKA